MNLIDDDLKIDNMVEDDVPNFANDFFTFFTSHIWAQILASILVVFIICFFSVAMHISTHYDKLGSPYERTRYYQVLVLFFVTFIIAFIAWIFTIRFLIKPVFKIRQEMLSIKSGNLYKQIEIEGTNELWQLAKNYNLMATELGNQKLECAYEREERIKAVEARHIAEQKSVQYLINTDFVYEINNYILENKDSLSIEKENEILQILANILHYLSIKDASKINIGSELAWINDYLHIQKILKGNLFDYEIDLPDNLVTWPCVKLIILPYVENCIVHGFNDKTIGGMIKIFASETQNKLILSIWDNGKGFEKNELSKIKNYIKNHNSSVSFDEKNSLMRNISTLYDFYGERLDIKINSMQDDGTCITLSLPLPNKFSWQGLEQ